MVTALTALTQLDGVLVAAGVAEGTAVGTRVGGAVGVEVGGSGVELAVAVAWATGDDTVAGVKVAAGTLVAPARGLVAGLTVSRAGAQATRESKRKQVTAMTRLTNRVNHM